MFTFYVIINFIINISSYFYFLSEMNEMYELVIMNKRNKFIIYLIFLNSLQFCGKNTSKSQQGSQCVPYPKSGARIFPANRL